MPERKRTRDTEGIQTNSAYAEFICSRKTVPMTPATARPTHPSRRSSDAPAARRRAGQACRGGRAYPLLGCEGTIHVFWVESVPRLRTSLGFDVSGVATAA